MSLCSPCAGIIIGTGYEEACCDSTEHRAIAHSQVSNQKQGDIKMKNTNITFSGNSGASTIRSVAGLFLALLFSGLASAGTINGTAHDFTAQAWSGGQICVACHTPHGGNTTIATAPLWNHAVTNATYTLYSTSTLNAAVGQPDGVSKLCLSCHDGTVALDSFGGATGSTFMTGAKAVGAVSTGSLANDHPISFTYDDTLATTDGALHPPTSTNVTIGAAGKQKTGTISNTILFSGKVQCASCHDVHNTFTDSGKLLRVSMTGSKLCLTCHNK